MKKIYHVKGMHCRSCEVLIENEVKRLPGVKQAHASQKKGTLAVESAEDVSTQINNAVVAAGYSIGKEDLPLITNNAKTYLEVAFGVLIVGILFYLLRIFKLDGIFAPASFASTSYAAIFTIGLTAGFSSCMALVGGLVLGASASHAEKHPNATVIQKFRPHLFFNLGRLISFFVLGGVLGEIGSVLRLSGPILGFLTILVGVVMFGLGLQIVEIFPRFSGFSLPKIFTGFTGTKSKEYSHGNSIWLGALTFFLPCGFTQAMQVYAISTGSFFQGAMIMLLFAMGTAPGLLGIGGLTSVISNSKIKGIFFKTVGILILALSFYNLSNGFNLLGLRISTPKIPQEKKQSQNQIQGPSQESEKTTVTLEDGVQVIKSVYDPSYIGEQFVIKPNQFTVKVNVPVRVEILAKQNGLGCMGSVMIPGLANEPKFFVEGEKTIYEFIPKKTGTFQITCAMGVPSGVIEVTN